VGARGTGGWLAIGPLAWVVRRRRRGSRAS
jgi:hypothetical protein